MSRLKLLTIAGLTMGLLGGMAPAAFAGDTPTPDPTFTRPVPVPVQNCFQRPITFAPTAGPTDEVSPAVRGDHPTPTVTPTVNPQARCRPEQFVAQVTALGSTVVQNRVIANGPVFGTGSLDLAAQTNVFDRALLPVFGRSVDIRHTGILPGDVNVNLPLCAVSVNKVGLWRFAGGQGLFRNARGNGSFLLTGQWVFPNFRGICSLRFIRGNPLLSRITPRYTNIQVWATGLARR